MKHAICLICYKNLSYIENFVRQFENDDRFSIFIHWFGFNNNDKKKLLEKYSNIKCIYNKFFTKRFSSDLVWAELDLYRKAYMEDPDIEMFHLFSESDYLICSLDKFDQYFSCYKDENFLIFESDTIVKNYRIFKKYTDIVTQKKASQWKSLNRNTIDFLLNNQTLIHEYLEDCLPGKWAKDEVVIPTILYNEYNNNYMHGKRYIKWPHFVSDHPITFFKSNYDDTKYRISNNIFLTDIKNNLIIRKIDIMNKDSRNFLEMVKNS